MCIKKRNVLKVTEIERIKPISNEFNKIKGETKLYRYMSFKKLETIFRSSEIYLSNITKNYDNHEREIPASFFNGWPDTQAEHYKSLSQIVHQNVFAYISCWSTQKDDYALWKIYDDNKDGCMLETTFDKLKAQFPEETVFYEVKYVGKNDDKKKYNLQVIYLGKDGIPTIRGCEEFKRFPYKFEHEIRGVLYSKTNVNGILVKMNIEKLVTGAMYNPFSKKEDQQRVEKLIHSKLPNLIIESSVIDESDK